MEFYRDRSKERRDGVINEKPPKGLDKFIPVGNIENKVSRNLKNYLKKKEYIPNGVYIYDLNSMDCRPIFKETPVPFKNIFHKLKCQPIEDIEYFSKI